MIDIPYNELELRIAAIGMEQKVEEHKDAIKNILESKSSFSTEADRYKEIADHYGITVVDLMNSPNLGTLLDKYGESIMLYIRKDLLDLGFEDKETWAFILVLNGKL